MTDYLASTDFENYGVSFSEGFTQVKAASTIIDAHLLRPEGLLWAPDVNGHPCYMDRASVQRSWKVQGATSAGANAVLTLDSVLPASMLGEGLIFDRATQTVVEPVVVTAIDGTSVTLANVANAHADQMLLESGLVISQRATVGFGAPVAFLSRTPVASLIAIGTRVDLRSYKQPGLSDSRFGDEREAFGFGVVPNFPGNFAQWTLLDPTICDCDNDTGELRVGIVGRTNEVRTTYLAGYANTSVPHGLKLACAKLANVLINSDVDMPVNVKSLQAGGSKIEKFSASIIDDDVKRLLEPFALIKGI